MYRFQIKVFKNSRKAKIAKEMPICCVSIRGFCTVLNCELFIAESMCKITNLLTETPTHYHDAFLIHNIIFSLIS